MDRKLLSKASRLVDEGIEAGEWGLDTPAVRARVVRHVARIVETEGDQAAWLVALEGPRALARREKEAAALASAMVQPLLEVINQVPLGLWVAVLGEAAEDLRRGRWTTEDVAAIKRALRDMHQELLEASSEEER